MLKIYWRYLICTALVESKLVQLWDVEWGNPVEWETCLINNRSKIIKISGVSLSKVRASGLGWGKGALGWRTHSTRKRPLSIPKVIVIYEILWSPLKSFEILWNPLSRRKELSHNYLPRTIIEHRHRLMVSSCRRVWFMRREPRIIHSSQCFISVLE